LERPLVGVSGALSRLSGVSNVEQTQTPEGHPAYRIIGRDTRGADLLPAIYDLARQEDWPLRELHQDVRTLETVFNELAMSA
jgi:hypothetical protein